MSDDIVPKTKELHEEIEIIKKIMPPPLMLEDAIKRDITLLRQSNCIIPETEITGWIYDVETGKVSAHCQALASMYSCQAYSNSRVD